jgi:glycine/D-amino acid oxidase-like deaminating enzyme
MPERWDAIVVGAGICGLAAAYELSKRGRRVVVLEAEGVGAGQSAGLARIFRIAHADPRLCALALEARERWRRWEDELGVRLLADEGLVVAPGHAHAAAMPGPVERLGRAEIRARVPLLNHDHPYDEAIWDPLAGALRTRRALSALAARTTVRRARVTGVTEDGRVTLANATTLNAGAVLVCAGLGTQALTAPLGLDLELTSEPHVRVTYDAPAAAACLISPDCYALPLGRTGRYAIGMHAYGAEPAMFAPMPPVGTIECVSLFAPWLAGGDGFVALRTGRVLALGASNAMKFGPLLGDRLARSALAPDGVHDDLAVFASGPSGSAAAPAR